MRKHRKIRTADSAIRELKDAVFIARIFINQCDYTFNSADIKKPSGD